MSKHYKTDYFDKMKQLTTICCDNISIAQKIISSEHSATEKNAVTGKNIFQRIRICLEKDFFTPFEREDIFIISSKLSELSENTQLLCVYSEQTDVFSITSDLRTLIECLNNIAALIFTIITRLSEYPKQGDLTVFFNKTEQYQYDFQKKFFNCSAHTKNNALFLLADECAKNCKEITVLIQYTLIKNS